MKKSKKVIISLVIILVIIATIIGIAIKFKSSDNDNKKSSNKYNKVLSKIDAEELEKILIEKLEDTSLNVNEYYGDAQITTKFEKYDSDDQLNMEKGWVYAYITGVDIEEYGIGSIRIPCFKIETDKDGNFKNIEYMTATYMSCIDGCVEEVVKDTFKEEYDIDFGDYYETLWRGSFGKCSADIVYIDELSDTEGFWLEVISFYLSGFESDEIDEFYDIYGDKLDASNLSQVSDFFGKK